MEIVERYPSSAPEHYQQNETDDCEPEGPPQGNSGDNEKKNKSNAEKDRVKEGRIHGSELCALYLVLLYSISQETELRNTKEQSTKGKVLSTSLLVTRSHDRLNISPNVKVSFNFHPYRITSRDEVFENYVCHVLVENFHISERVDVKLQTLQFNATFIGDIFNANRSEVGKV
jgi:hypothetical protein